MPRTTLVLDGLWLCLCPSFNINTLSGARVTLGASQHAKRRFSSLPLKKSMPARPTFGPEEPATIDSSREPDQRDVTHEDSIIRLLPDQSIPFTSYDQVTTFEFGDAPETLSRKSTQALETRLQEITAKNPRIQNTAQILRILIHDRQVHPDTRHYRALILAHSDAVRGSTKTVRRLLAEMESNGIAADSGTLHAALQVSAVHPDYLLRQDVLRALRERWLSLSPTGWHYVVAGLLREHQFELALDHIGQMERKGVVVESWLFNMLVYYLCELQEWDEVLRLMRSRTEQHREITPELCSYVLEMASMAAHTETIWFIWKHKVELRYLRPSHAICNKVLGVAAHIGDVDLASSVIQYMAESEFNVTLQNYECMVAAHVVSGDLYAGLEVLCRMHKAGISLRHDSTRLVLKHMIEKNVNPRDVWAMLKKLKATKLPVPLLCALVVFEKCEHEALSDPLAVEDGVALYNELYTLCPNKADVSLFNVLINMCRRGENSDAGMFVVHEMAKLGVVPDGVTFEHLVMMCLDTGNYESAYMYFQDLLYRGFSPSDETRAAIREICSHSRDQYARQLRYHPRIQDGSIQCLVDGMSSAGEHDRALSKVSSEVPWRESPRYPTMKFEPSFLQSKIAERKREVYKEIRRMRAKEARKRRRRAKAIQQAMEEEGWEDYEPGGLVPENLPDSSGEDSQSG
ncbi:pentatricopeptide repeat protein [Aspergillus homomorphus CBS 101889]|uniref:Pentatricopeptide repeat protein n=1 Tax=Aspergillus homomorphus (strain CBS 101889) TaxID=1450537 RepID=A0A395IEV1_ASPHC|nr:pentatricopeptide repeat protein [Aspergillus homomorphus CBS 101889]RAL17713.1 pentatricopeptide repeat protein [Aspergillus homomorphus CBS 101889]